MLGQVANARTAASDTMANAWLRIMTAMDTDESELGSDSDHELSILTSHSFASLRSHSEPEELMNSALIPRASITNQIHERLQWPPYCS